MPEAAPRTQSNSLDRLREAARSLFVRNGYHYTRPQDIVREAGVANGTFYLHFKDKREAFLDFAEQAQNELLALYLERLAGVSDRRQRWRIIFNTVIDFSIQHPGLLHAAFFDPLFIAPDDPEAWRLYDRLGQLIRLAVGDEAAAERLGQQYDLELISHALTGMFRNALIFGARKGIDRDKLIDEL
ncbi:MAG: TetR/AcrR family transcriptional regulator, partial [Pseudomonadales bacterium]